MGAFLPFIIPGGLLALIPFLVVHFGLLVKWAVFFKLYPLIVIFLVLFFGIRFNRMLLIVTTALMVVSERLLFYLPTMFENSNFSRLIFNTIAILLAVDMAILSVMKERGFMNRFGIARLIFFLAQPLVALFLFKNHFNLLNIYLKYSFVKGVPDFFKSLDQPALFAFFLSLVFYFVMFIFLKKTKVASYFWATFLILIAFLLKGSVETTTLYFTTAAFLLLTAMVEDSYRMAFKDELTGLNGRRALEEECLKLAGSYSAAMVDIDHFKNFNDTFGHDVGDQVLRKIANKISKIEGGGKPFRYGGEEFTILFHGKELEEVLPHLEEIREDVASSPFYLRGKDREKSGTKVKKKRSKNPKVRKSVTVTISIGVAERGEDETPQEVLKQADEALYKAKKAGRNCIQS